MKKVQVPAGLKKCKTCGYYKGITQGNNGDRDVSCACHKQICKRCGEKVYDFPIGSTVFDEQRGLLHIPVFCAWGHTCPDGVKGQLENSFLINPRTGEDLLHPDTPPTENKYVVLNKT